MYRIAGTENHCPVGELVKAYPSRDLVHTM